MGITLPDIQFPWNRKTTKIAGIEVPRFELPNINAASLERAKANMPKVDAAKLAEASAATIGAVAGQAAERAGQLGQEAGKVSRDVAASGEANLRSLGAELKDLSRDVRSLRITREKKGPDMMPGIALLGGLGGGLAAMYFFDAEQGPRRRALLRDQLNKWTRVASETLSGRAEDLRNRTAGLAHETRSAIAGATGAGDAVADDMADSVVTSRDASAALADTDAAAAASDPVAYGEPATDVATQTPEADQMYGALNDTVREAWGSGDESDEVRSDRH
ncbi:hypothetical protein BH24CHL7_BH24CHL7_02000 [soil metagenome]